MSKKLIVSVRAYQERQEIQLRGFVRVACYLGG
jgi:hypothetical protein